MRVGEALAGAGLEPREARLLLARAGGWSEASLLAHPERDLPRDIETLFAQWVARRRAGEPVAYLLGEREFYGLELGVTPAVLIPRPDTEVLVEQALARIPLNTEVRVLDLGTGSGAIALAVKCHRPRARVVAVDASGEALAVARGNARRLGLEIDFRLGCWCEPLRGERFDVLLSNPPYVAERDPHLGQGDLRFEPRAALLGGVDGLDAIRAIVAQARSCMYRGAWLLLEHGFDQAAAARALFDDAGFGPVESWTDLAGNPRVTGARYHRDAQPLTTAGGAH